MNCKSWKRYQGIRKPKCNSGVGCPACWNIYLTRLGYRKESK